MELLKDIKDLFRPVLSDRQIKKYMEKGLLIEDPINESQLQPNSVDLTLANTWSKLNHNRVVIDKYLTPPPGEHTSEPETIDVPIMEKDGVTHHRVKYPMHSISIRSANEVETRPIDLRIPLSYTSG